MYQNLYYSIFIWSSTCFGRHTAHHQEPKTAMPAYGFSYVEGCWTCSRWTISCLGLCLCLCLCLTTSANYASKKPSMYEKTRGCQCSFRLLMMGGVSPETCWASYKYGIIKILIYCCILFDFSLWICTMMHGSANMGIIVTTCLRNHLNWVALHQWPRVFWDA